MDKIHKEILKAKNSQTKQLKLSLYKTYRNIIVDLRKKSKESHYRKFFEDKKKRKKKEKKKQLGMESMK